MKCENCYHARACLNSLSENKGLNNTESFVCEHYKDKSLVFELPCRVGDVLFTTEYDCDSNSSYIEKIECISIEIHDCGISIYCKSIERNYDTYVPEDFGETVFLSREEAERALEEINIEKNNN